uniref:Uncharacterized protein n=1 Tax=Ascaris lumbricoides TaxID=6252 RepID=A0A0M3IWU9_ASCLU
MHMITPRRSLTEIFTRWTLLYDDFNIIVNKRINVAIYFPYTAVMLSRRTIQRCMERPFALRTHYAATDAFHCFSIWVTAGDVYYR